MFIYLDNSATTVPYPEVMDVYNQASKEYYGNPSSLHKIGSEADKVLRSAREVAANVLHIFPDEIIFTAGGTEGNNMAIQGVAYRYRERGKHLITTQIEHASVLNTFKHLESEGYSVTYLPVDRNGHVAVTEVEAAIRKDTILVSIMHVNSEVGVVQPIAAIGDIVKKHPKIIFHVDAVQSFGKIPLHIKKWGIDLLTLSGHKFHGPKGAGLLYKAEKVALQPLFFGGGQEFGLRSGTQNVPQIIAFTKALRMSAERQSHFNEQVGRLRERLWGGLETIHEAVINSPKEGAPHIVNVSFIGIKPEVMLHALEKRGILVSTKSACSSKEQKTSHVLEAMHVPVQQAQSALRFSLSSFTTEREIDATIVAIKQCVIELHGIA